MPYNFAADSFHTKKRTFVVRIRTLRHLYGYARHCRIVSRADVLKWNGHISSYMQEP